VIEPARDRGQVVEADRDVARRLFEDRAALVLRELPPRVGLLDRDQRGARRGGATELGLHRGQPPRFVARGVALVRAHAAEDPRRVRWFAGLGVVQARDRCEWCADDRGHSIDAPGAGGVRVEASHGSRIAHGVGRVARRIVSVYDPVVDVAVVLACLAACGSQPASGGLGNRTAASDVDVRTLSIASVCIDPTGSARAAWPAGRRGGAFVLADANNYVATATIGPHEFECDHCSGPDHDAVLVERGVARSGCFTAFGPVAAPFPHARIARIAGVAPASAHAVTEWADVERIDVDGDGAFDLALVEQCAEVVPSGCSDHVCHRICTGVRAAGSEVPAAGSVECRRFVPDVADCVP
jgi:hypothetical protein